MRSRFICAMRAVYMRTQTTRVRATMAKAGRKMARGIGRFLQLLAWPPLPFGRELIRARVRRRLPAFAGTAITGRLPGTFPAGCLLLPRQHQLLDLADRLGRVQALRAGPGAVHDRVAAVELERILEVVQSRAGVLVAAVDDPAIRLQQDRGAEVAVAVPPVARAAGRAAGAEDALVQAVELGAVFLRLQALARRRRALRAQPGADRGVLGI